MRFARALALVLVTSAGVACPAFADDERVAVEEQPTDAVALQTESADSPAGATDLPTERTDLPTEATEEPPEEIVVLGVRPGRIAERPSAFTATIDIDDFEGEQKSLVDLLGAEAGVQVRRFGGPGERAEVSIRGSTGAQVAVTLDGVRLNSALTGSTDLSQLCLGLIESAEVARGGDSLRSGEGAIGGAVDLRTRRAGDEPRNRVYASGGAFGTWDAGAFRSASAGPLDYGVGYCGFTTDGDYTFARPDISVQGQPATTRPPLTRINNESERHAATVSLAGDTGSVGELRFGDYLSYEQRGEPGLDSGDDPLGGQNPFASSEGLQNVARLAWSADALGWLGDTFELGVHHRYQGLEFDDPGTTALDVPVWSETDVHTAGANLEQGWSFEALAAVHALELLADAERDALYASEQDDVGRTQAGVALVDELSFAGDRVLLVPGVRLAWVQGFGERWLPALGLVLSPWPWLRLQANAQRSFRAPSFDELYLPDKGFLRGNAALRPERADNADAGVVLDFDRLGPFTAVRFEGGVFLQEIDDSIVWIPVSPNTVEPNNTGPARVRGYELALAFELTRFARVRANHTGLESESLTTGRPLPGRAENETFVRLELGPRGRWKLVGEMQRTGEIPVSPSGAIRLPAREVWSASAAINLASFPPLRPRGGGAGRLRELWLYAALNNIGDVAVRDALFFPQPGRSGFLGAEIEW